MSDSIFTTPNKQEIQLPVLEPSLGLPVADITKLHTQASMFTYDPGFTSTASCWSKITFIDGEKGILLHRGYPIQELAAKKTFVDVIYLIINGELPTEEKKKSFEQALKKRSHVPKSFHYLFKSFPKESHPMALLMTAVSAMAGHYHDQKRIKDPAYHKEVILHIIATIPTLSAMVFKHIHGESFIEPDPNMDYTENFLHMCFSKPNNKHSLHQEVINILDKIFILHADHEQNASTSTVRLAGSTESNPYACIASGIAALWGPAHGGANESALNMLTIIGNKLQIPHYLEQVKAKKIGFKLMGFGHRIYKNYDPRAGVLKEACHNVLQKLGVTNDPLFELALELEQKALHDSYFIERKLFPNVDFYSGIILKAMQFPSNYFTVLFALARTTGWIAQWQEMISDPNMKISRPRQLYIGEKIRSI